MINYFTKGHYGRSWNSKRIEDRNINFLKTEYVKLLDGRKIEAIIYIADFNKKRQGLSSKQRIY
jgi:hypothetical protein